MGKTNKYSSIGKIRDVTWQIFCILPNLPNLTERKRLHCTFVTVHCLNSIILLTAKVHREIIDKLKIN